MNASNTFKTLSNMNSTSQMKKSLRLSTDQSDSSFNNMTIKSADKYNSLVRNALSGSGHIPTSTKNASISLDKNNMLN